jgi:peptide/nickel transport system ATP-binding protein
MISPQNGFRISGNLSLNGNKINPGKERTIQPVFQDPTLYFNPSWTMKSCLLEPFILRNISENIALKEVKEALEYFSLHNCNLENKPANFSGGELQRLSILRAVFFNPEILLMDEPVSGLDRLVLYDTINFLKKLQSNKNLTIFIVSHDLEFIANISEFIYIIYNGEIVEYGNTSEVLKSPSNQYTIDLLKSRDLSGIKK